LTLSGGAVSFLSTLATPVILASAAENDITMKVTRLSDNTNATLTPNNLVALSVGYNGTTATLTTGFASNGQPVLTTSVAGGLGANLNINLVTSQLTTIQALVNFINSQTGYTASVGSTLAGQLPSFALNTLNNTYQWTLDVGTFGICSSNGGQPGRIKDDAYAFFNAVNSGTSAIILTQSAVTNAATSNAAIVGQPLAGLPDPTINNSLGLVNGAPVQMPFYIGSGVGGIAGATGGTSNANVTNALAACQNLTANFVVPLFSQNAGSTSTEVGDIALGLTDPSSTYTISAINAATLNHVVFMSTILQKGNRQAFCSNRDTFVNDLAASSSLANYRVSLAFQDYKVVDQNGNITQFQPWMGSVLAASMQAAGFYRSIMRKQINTNGVLQNTPTGFTSPDFNAVNKSQLTQALLGGLLVAQPATTGGWQWVSDQTTYAVDNNFVYNSIQAVYAADLIALTIQQRMETLFTGQSLADVSAASALTALQSIMADLKRLKLIAASQGNPSGYNSPSIQIQGYVMQVSVNAFLANALAFIPITVNISQVTQSASTT